MGEKSKLSGKENDFHLLYIGDGNPMSLGRLCALYVSAVKNMDQDSG